MDQTQNNLSDNIQNIPLPLKLISQWVCWCYEERDGKLTKPPVNPNSENDGYASSTDPKTWGTFEEAYSKFKECENGHIAGVGFVLNGNDLIAGDLDHCIDTKGEILPWAKEIIEKVKTYCEITPSGKGIRFFIKGSLPFDGKKKGDFEIYQRSRYVTVTGHHLDGTPTTIEDRQTEIEEMVREFFQTYGFRLSDDEVILKAKSSSNGEKFNRLWEGVRTDYPSQSEADLALCSILAFWTRKNPEQIDRLFRQSGLMRPKWDERHHGDGKTYGEGTISKVFDSFRKPMSYHVSDDVHVDITPEKNEILIGRNLTEFGTAECFKELCGDRFCFVPERKGWFKFNGIRWEENNESAVLSMAELIRARATAGTLLMDKERQGKIFKYALGYESNQRIGNCLELASSMIVKRFTEFDTDPYLLCCNNGVVDLRTGEFRQPLKDEYLHKTTEVEFNLYAEIDRFGSFLEEIFNKDKETIDYIQKAIGYTLTGKIGEQCLFMAYGKGSNGKSVLFDTIQSLLGQYGCSSPTALIKDSRYESIPNDIARLSSMRFTKIIEIKENVRINEERTKALTGGDIITGRFLHREFFDYRPQFKLWVSVNHKPSIRGTDTAIWRRIRLIPFEVTIPKDQQDKHLVDKMKEELPGILNWAIQGCLKWQKEGLETISKVQKATDEYRKEEDILQHFLDENVETCLGQKVQAVDLYNRYTSWTKTNGEHTNTNTWFGKKMVEKEYIRKPIAGKNYYIGVVMR